MHFLDCCGVHGDDKGIVSPASSPTALVDRGASEDLVPPGAGRPIGPGSLRNPTLMTSRPMTAQCKRSGDNLTLNGNAAAPTGSSGFMSDLSSSFPEENDSAEPSPIPPPQPERLSVEATRGTVSPNSAPPQPSSPAAEEDAAMEAPIDSPILSEHQANSEPERHTGAMSAFKGAIAAHRKKKDEEERRRLQEEERLRAREEAYAQMQLEAQQQRLRMHEEVEKRRRQLQEEAEAEMKRLQDEAVQMRSYMQEELDKERARKEELARQWEELQVTSEQDTRGRQKLEQQLADERRRAEKEAEGRRKLETQIQRERRIMEEAEERRELERMRLEEEQQRSFEAARAAAQRRIEEERRLAAQAAAERRARQEEEREERTRLHAVAHRRSEEAQEARENKERVRAFLAEHGHRHVRAKTTRWTLSNSYPLHQAVRQRDAEMVHLLLEINADPAQVNAFGVDALRYAQSKKKCEAVDAMIAHLQAAGAPSGGPHAL